MTTKQEALELILRRVRLLEEPGSETPAVAVPVARIRLRDVCQRLGAGAPASRESLIALGALVVHLLRDEVDVVSERSLEEWLADKEEKA